MKQPERPLRVALLGFSAFEVKALCSTLLCAQDRRPLAYALAHTLLDADLFLVDADSPSAISLFRSLPSRPALFVGVAASSEAEAWALRPINTLHILRELDVLVQRPGSAGAAHFKPAHVDHRLGPPPSARPSYAEPAEGLAAGRHPGRRGREARCVLVFDPHAESCDALRRLLHKMGLQVSTCSNPDDALEQLARVRFTAVFIDGGARTDKKAPYGHEAMKLAQRIRRGSTLPEGLRPQLILVTPISGPADRVRAMLAGFNAVLPKPVEGADLRQRLAGWSQFLDSAGDEPCRSEISANG